MPAPDGCEGLFGNRDSVRMVGPLPDDDNGTGIPGPVACGLIALPGLWPMTGPAALAKAGASGPRGWFSGKAPLG